MSRPYDLLLDRVKELGRLAAIDALLEWDQDTQLPARGVAARADMTAQLATLRHERLIDPAVPEWLAAADPVDPAEAAIVRETHRAYHRAANVPPELVHALAHAAAHAREAWATARRDNHFPTFAPHLQTLLDLKRQQADAIGYDGDIYDALLDEFEPGATAATVAALFAELQAHLTPLIEQLADGPRQPDASIVTRHYPVAAQQELARHLATAIGFDFDAGRLDVSVHPFCLSMTCDDVRITTRYDEQFFSTAIFGVLHETGHGLYEQGLDPRHAFTPLSAAVSLGIHESQSRWWENFVGRSRPFWEHHYARAQADFPASLGDVALGDFHAAINAVAPSLIRVEADEVTYNLHIILRFEIERELLAGQLTVAEVPDRWNAGMHRLLGVKPPTDREGCLQDIHWSIGIFGYFPTYALGNLYAAQFFAAATQAIPDWADKLRAGDAAPLLDWLRTHIHRHGQQYRADELCQQVTGQGLSCRPFVDYITAKYSAIYGLTG